MTGHDPLCPRGESYVSTCECDLIALARADERLKADRERQREVAATAKWCRADERERIAADLEATIAADCDQCDTFAEVMELVRFGGGR